jgi:PAS domain S-box-containing protein
LSCGAIFIALLWALHRRRVHQLKVQEKRLRDVVETIPAMTFTALSDGSCTFVNKRWTEYTGLSVEETSGAGWQRAIHPEDLVRHSEKWRFSVASGQVFEDEARFRRAADGEYRWFLVRGVPLRDQHGTVVRWYGTLTDIEDRKRAGEALELTSHDLQDSKAKLEEAQRIAHVGYWEWDLTSNRVIWSDETYRIYGLRPQEYPIDIAVLQEMIHPEDLEFVFRVPEEAVRGGLRTEVEHRIIRPSGELRTVHSLGDLKKDASGRLLQMFGTVQDVTDRKRAEDKIHEQEAELRQIVDLAPQLVTVFGPHRERLYANRFLLDYLGISLDEWRQRPDSMEFLHPDDRERVRAHSDRALSNGAAYESEFRVRKSSGGYRWFLTRFSPMRDDKGQIMRWYVAATDIEDRKRAENEREKLRQLEADLAHINRVSMLGEMAASLAHEIKQPIAAAITSANSCIEWLAHEPPNLDRARAAATRIDKYGNRAAEIIDRIRSFYKKSFPQRELVDVNGIIQEMITLLECEANRYSVAMHTELASELPKIMVDRVQLQQVFMNLMLNAIEAMTDSGGELTVKSELQDGQLQFSVSDTGVGLSTEKMDQIFSAFFTTKLQGSGMGLAISRSIVESHGGRLWATSNDGRGATFHFTLPIQATESSPLVV